MTGVAGSISAATFPSPLHLGLARRIHGPPLMRTIILGSAGSGKTPLAQTLMASHAATSLSLDAVVFQDGVERRPLDDSLARVRRWMASHGRWVIEGCYADRIEPLLEHCDALIFLNPGIEACVAQCRARPWEPEKYSSPEEQDAHLESLIQWVRSHETRSDKYGLPRHRALFDAYTGRKREDGVPPSDAAID
jgi:adenylate kinase family enzyme